MKLHSMWDNYPQLAVELEQTLQLMEKSIHLKNKPVEKALLEMVHSGGKLLRPAYQLLFSQFGPQRDEKKAVALAASIEMLHTATLIHDDIVDTAATRRGLPTIRTQFSNEVAVYAGDYLFVCCFKLLANYANSLKSLQLNSRSMEKILSGELGQMDQRYNTNLTIPQYIENISGKTAELFALSCSIGAYESGVSESFAKRCSSIGKDIGIAFQIIDDILDYTQPASTIGKPVLEDVKQGIYSLPLLYTLEKKADALLPYLKKQHELTEQDTQAILSLVQTNGVTQAQQLAEAYTMQALKNIQRLPDIPAKHQLILLTETILERHN